MADNNVKYVPVFIPEDSMNDWEKVKTVTINGVMYSIPVGETVEVPEFVADVIKEWQESIKKNKENYKNRIDDLRKNF